MIPLSRFTASENFGRPVEDARRPFLALAREEAERRDLSFMPARSHRASAKSRRGITAADGHCDVTYGEITAAALCAES
jgi:hypothetical protein